MENGLIAVPPPFTDPVSFIEAVVWLLGLVDLAGKCEHIQALLMKDSDNPLVVLTPTTQ